MVDERMYLAVPESLENCLLLMALFVGQWLIGGCLGCWVLDTARSTHLCYSVYLGVFVGGLRRMGWWFLVFWC